MQIAKRQLITSLIILGIIILACISYVIYNKQTKTVADPDINDIVYNNQTKTTADPEVTFENPINIKWMGKVLTFMMSGKAYALEKIPSDQENPYFYAEPFETLIGKGGLMELKYPAGSVIEITGKQVGISCGYQYSVFGGYCVPDVIVESVSLVK